MFNRNLDKYYFGFNLKPLNYCGATFYPALTTNYTLQIAPWKLIKPCPGQRSSFLVMHTLGAVPKAS